MSHIDKLITQAHLMDITVIDFETQLNAIEQDIENHRNVLKRYDIKEDKTLSLMMLKEEQLRTLMKEWLKQADLPSYREYRITILIEEHKE